MISNNIFMSWNFLSYRITQLKVFFVDKKIICLDITVHESCKTYNFKNFVTRIVGRNRFGEDADIFYR